MYLTSPAFFDGGAIPVEYTCDGQNISPPLRWSAAPKQTKSFVLLMSDTDTPAGVWRHWAVYDIPAHHTDLREGAGLPEGFEDFRHGVNDFKHFGYSGPCPAHNRGIHHYRFRLLALDVSDLPIRAHPTAEEVEREAQKHAVAEATLNGICRR